MNKKLIILALTIFGLQSTFANQNANDFIPVEPEVEQIFVIQKGFDSNDNIQVVVDGHIPNACYTFSETKITIKENHIDIYLPLQRKNINECFETPAEELTWPIRFSKVLNLGKLKAGEYSVHYKIANRMRVKTQKFTIDQSATRSVDDMLYAPITSVFIPEIVSDTNNGEVILTGELGSSCAQLYSKDIKVLKQGNVFVILPKLTITTPLSCIKKTKGIYKIVTLGKLEPGRYLIHVRSMTGSSINRTFSVNKRSFNPGMFN